MNTGMSASSHQPAADRFAVLWTDYLEGDLDPAGMQELNMLLAADDSLVKLAADLYQTHRRLGWLAVSAAGEGFVEDVMRRLPAAAADLTRDVMGRIAGLASDAGQPPTPPDGRGQHGGRLLGGSIVAAAVAMGLAGLALFTRPSGDSPAPLENAARNQTVARLPQPATEGESAVRFASLARARFLHRQTPARHSEATWEETYVLSQGLVQLAFPRGATAILEGPAVFRVCGSDCLAVNAGRCSIHAPAAAAGFRVETPATRVIDRGTRFLVTVDETTATEVQVIEGAADVVAQDNGGEAAKVHRLRAGDVAHHEPTAERGGITVRRLTANQRDYQQRLPDRLISYTAALRHSVAQQAGDASDPGIDTLRDVTVQRDGVVHTYAVDELIGVTLLHFRAGRNHNNLTSPGSSEFSGNPLAEPTARRALLESDRLLTTGLINPGGASTPLEADPILRGDDAQTTPGLAVRFVDPVVNAPGPDVVFFELQMLTDPETGDAFHVSPLRFTGGLHSHTVTTYDIDSTAPESQLLARFRLFMLAGQARSLTELLELSTGGGSLLPVRAKANAVGIDLSDLGYDSGQRCEGLFFQDADDDKTTADPVFIAGLPPLEERATGPGQTEAERGE